MITVTANEIQNNLAKYLQIAQDDGEVRIMFDGRIFKVSLENSDSETAESFDEAQKKTERRKIYAPLTESVMGILKNDYDDKEMRRKWADEMRKKYESLG